jgi:hypothetical protein
MPLKLSVGLSKKIGLPDYGSLGASCHVELELDSTLLATDLDAFQGKVKQAFVACSQAVKDELSRQHQPVIDPRSHSANGNGNPAGQVPRRDKTRPATASQVRALEAIAKRQKVDLVDFLYQRFRTHTVQDLSITEASSLIDELNASTNGKGRAA